MALAKVLGDKMGDVRRERRGGNDGGREGMRCYGRDFQNGPPGGFFGRGV